MYAIYLALTSEGGQVGRPVTTSSPPGRDFRFLPAFEHIAVYLVIWLVVLVVLVLFLALMLHGGVRRTVPFFRFLFYIPGALAGSAERPGLALHARPARQPLAFRALPASTFPAWPKRSHPGTCLSSSP